jgi:hypothetical protein
MGFIPWAHDAVLSILEGVLDCAEAAGRGDPDGLKTLYDGLTLEMHWNCPYNKRRSLI